MKSTLNLYMLISLVVGNMVGSGIFLLPSALAQYGSISIFAWLFTSAGAILIALVFSRLSQMLPKAGGPYVYCHEAFGNFWGFEVAFLYWIYSWVGNAAIAISLISYIAYFFPQIAQDPLISFVMIISVVWLLTLINYLGLRKAGVLQLITVIIKLIPLIAVCVFGLFYIHIDNFAAVNVSGKSHFQALSSSATLTMWALTGIESATVPANHVNNPERTIPIATVTGTSIAVILYVLSTIALMGVIPMHELARSSAPFAEATRLIVGPVGGSIIALAAIASCVGALNGWILLQGQVPQAASANGVFPKSFSKLSKYGTPGIGLIISSLLITILVAMNFNKGMVDKFTAIISLATLAILLVYALVIVAELVLLKKMKRHIGLTKWLFNSMALTYIAWAIYGSDREMLLYCILMAVLGVPIYYVMHRSKNK